MIQKWVGTLIGVGIKGNKSVKLQSYSIYWNFGGLILSVYAISDRDIILFLPETIWRQLTVESGNQCIVY